MNLHQFNFSLTASGILTTPIYKKALLRFLFSILFLLLLGRGSYAQSVDPATGGGSISADDFNSGTFTSLTGPAITENSAGQISLGFIDFKAPSGFEWDTTGTAPAVNVTLAPGNNGQTQLRISFVSRTPSTLRFEVTRASDDGGNRPGQATFSQFRVRPTTGTLPNSGNITNAGSSAPGGNTNYGTLEMVAGATTKVRVETEPDGSGQVVPSQTITAGNTLTVYAITRDQNNNFKNNIAADSWSLINITGGVTSGDLTPAGDSKSATFSSTSTGSAAITLSEGTLDIVDSETITVEPDDPASLLINTQPSSTATAGQTFAQQPVIDILDTFGNLVTTNNSIQVTATRNTGTGSLQGTTTVTVVQGRATFTDLHHNVATTIDIDFSAAGLPIVTSNDITVSPAAASKLVFAVQPPNGSKNTALSPPPEVQIKDSFNNDVALQDTVDMSIHFKTSPSANITNSSTISVPTDPNTGRSVFDNLKFDNTGDFVIKASSRIGLDSTLSDTFSIFQAGKLANFIIEMQGGGNIPDTTAGKQFTLTISAVDGTGSLMDGTGQQTEYTGKALISSSGNSGTGIGDSTANFTGGTVDHAVSLQVAGSGFTIKAEAENSDGKLIENNSNTFTIFPDTADPATSTITASPNQITANGTSKSLIRIRLKDPFGNNLISGGDNVTLSTTAGTLLNTLADNGDGTYKQDLQSTTNVDTAALSATVNTLSITDQDTVEFIPGALDHFAVEAPGGGTIADQTAGQPFDIRITAQDANNNTVTGFNGTVDVTSNKTLSSGSSSSLANGVIANHSVTITESGQNDVTITATHSSSTETGTSAAFTVNPASTDPAATTISGADRFIQNDGSSTTTITVQAKDAFGNNRLSGGDNVTLTTTAGSFTDAVTDNGDGTYTRTLQSSTTIEEATIQGEINLSAIQDSAKVTFTEFNTWQSSGGGGNNPVTWDRADNWTLGIPTASQAVVIPTNPANAQKFPIVQSNPTVAFLEIRDNATVNVDPTFSITISNDLSGAGALIVDDGLVTVSGDITVANLNAGNSTLTLNGTAEQQIPGTIFTDSLNIENTSSAGIVSNGYVNAATQLTITGSSLTMQSGSTLEIFGNIAGNGTVNTDNTSVLVGGDITIANIDVSTSDVTFNGSSGQTINSINEYKDLTISNSTGVVLTDSSNITQTLTVNSGSILEAQDDLIGSTLSAAGSTIRLGRDFGITNVTSEPNTVEFIGGNPQELIDFDTFNNLTVNKTADEVTTTSDVIVKGTLSLDSGDLVMGSGTNLLAPNRSLSGGQIRFQLILNGKGWYSISSPIQASYNNFLDGTITQGYPGAFYSTGSNPGDTLQPNVLNWDEAAFGTDNQQWRTISDGANTVVESRGHFLYVFGDVSGSSLYNEPTPDTLDVGGAEFDGNGTEVTFNVTFNAPDTIDAGWNLVGNPYGATIDWDDSGNWTKTNIDNTIYIWDHTANSGNGEYLLWNGLTGSLGDGLIAPFQGFWVKANASNPELKVSEDAKTTGGVFRGKPSGSENNTAEKHPIVELKLEAGELQSQAFISFSEDASRWRDSRDGLRLLPFSDTFLELFTTLDDGTELSINNYPRQFGAPIEIPLHVGGIRNGQPLNGLYTLSWPSLKNIPADWGLKLVDRDKNQTVDLRNETFYSFDVKQSGSSEANGGPENSFKLKTRSDSDDARFVLKVEPGADAGNLPNKVFLDKNYPNPFNPETTISFGVPVQSKVTLVIYNILGRKIATLAEDRVFNAGSHTIKWNPKALASGVYLLRMQSENKSFIEKMTFIK